MLALIGGFFRFRRPGDGSGARLDAGAVSAERPGVRWSRTLERWCGAQTEVYYSPRASGGRRAGQARRSEWLAPTAEMAARSVVSLGPRLTLRAGYLDQLTWGVDAGYDYWCVKSVRYMLAGSDEGLEERPGSPGFRSTSG